MKHSISLILFAFLLSAFPIASPCFAQTPPYSGQQTRAIKSLSDREIEGYLKGKGMGFSKVAELNSYPGPRHVIDLADKLKLTSEQLFKSRLLYKQMLEQAKTLGRKYVAIEREIEMMFDSRSPDRGKLEILLSKSAYIRSQIRYSHIRAHIDQQQLLTKEQIAIYDTMRGYGRENSTGHGGMHHQHEHE